MYRTKEDFKELIGTDLTDIEKQNLLDAMIEVGALESDTTNEELIELDAEIEDQRSEMDILKHHYELLEDKVQIVKQELDRYKDIYGELN